MRLRVTLVRSVIGYSDRHRRTVAALGLRRIDSSAVHEDSKDLRGMLRQVAHLVRVEPAEGGVSGETE